MTNGAKIRKLATALSDYLEDKKRPDGTEFVGIRDGAPEWVRDVCRAAHDGGEILPDDMRFSMVHAAALGLSDLPDGDDVEEWIHELADADTPVYTADLVAWLATSSYRIGYLTEAIDEFGARDGFKALAIAHYLERREVYSAVAAALADVSLPRHGLPATSLGRNL